MIHFPQERAIVARQIANRLGEILALQYSSIQPVEGWEYVDVGTRQDVAPVPQAGWQPYELGSWWGGQDVTCWFRARAEIPEPTTGERPVCLLNPGGESLVLADGEPLQGLDANRQEVVLPRRFWGKNVELVLQSYSSPSNSNTGRRGFSVAAVALRDELIRSFHWDLKVAFDASNALDNESLTSRRILEHVEKCVKAVDLNSAGDRRAFRSHIASVRKIFAAGMEEFASSVGMGNVVLAGQSHIDVAWTWPLRETRRKVARTFSTVLNYMDQYPDYVYFQSQPQVYEWVKSHYPSLWSRIKEQVRAGRWEPTGASWVEQDTNIPSGESHVRQFLYGNRFFRREFGVHTRVFWLPDCFGFSFALPQILRKAGVEAFATTKLASNEFNEFPYSLFRWRGLDGSEVLAYQMPWEWNVTPANLLAHWNRFKQKTSTDEIPMTFGIGDGGGGPTAEMLENAERLKNVRGFPQARAGRFQDHFDRLMKSLNREDLPVYVDELYYEKHRGCQTTQSRTKRNNRKSELALREAEFLASCELIAGGEYPQETISEAWKTVLLNQFHDILPGSSIAEVYEDAEKDYAGVRSALQGVKDHSLRSLARRIDTRGEGDALIVWNSLGWKRDDVATTPLPSADSSGWSVLDHDGQEVATQPVILDSGAAGLLFEASDLPPMGYSVFRLVKRAPRARRNLIARRNNLENRFFEVALSKTGSISRIFDKLNNREVLPEGSSANRLVLFEDFPASADAWDIDFNFEEKFQEIGDTESVTVTERGPVRATVRVVKRAKNSRITQNISIWASLPRIDFATEVEWYEKHKLLKASFPVNVLSRKATYEIQFGAIERPTHRSSPVERARFEVPGHRWIDLSEADYGVSLMNDCKYGFDVCENNMRISLLRGSVSPDPHADEGQHLFLYSLYPHRGDWRSALTTRRAYELNAPLSCWIEKVHGGTHPRCRSFVSVDSPDIVIDTVKKAEDSDAIIIRVYESHGARGEATLQFGKVPLNVTECDLMEEHDVDVPVKDSSVQLMMKPWEIKTLKATFSNG